MTMDLDLATMVSRRDIRDTPHYQAVAEYYSALFAPATGLVHAVREIHPLKDGTVCVIGATFAGSLEDGPSYNAYRIDPATQAIVELRPGGRHMAVAADGRRCAIYHDDGVEIVDLLDGSSIARQAVSGVVEQLRWSPNGKLGLLVAGAGSDVSGAEGGFALRVAHDGPSWLPEVDMGGSDDVWRRLWIWESDDADILPVTTPPLNVWEFDWIGEDGFAVIASDHHGEGSWYGASLRLVDAATGKDRPGHCATDQLAIPRTSPDGGQVAFIEAVCSDRGIVCGTLRLWEGGAVRTLATGDVEVSDMHWIGPDRIAVAGLRGLETVVGVYDLAADRTETIWSSIDQTCGDHNPAIALSGEEIYASIESYAEAPKLVRLGKTEVVPLWSFAAAGASPVTGLIEPVRWTAEDGLEIEGLLLRPDDAARNLPLLVDIHGGPVWGYRNRWAARLRAAGPMVARGFAILLPNPRGSAGRGQDFARRVLGDMGGADTNDLISGLDHLAALGIIDRDKVVLSGGSYGGFMSSWLITQHTRIAASVPISPVTNWYSQHFTSQFPAFDEVFLDGSPISPVGQYFDRSPVFLAAHVRTPTLTLTGGRDKSTPPGQALEFHNALLQAGATSVLCTYPDDGHSLRGYPAYLDSAARVMMWAETYAAP